METPDLDPIALRSSEQLDEEIINAQIAYCLAHLREQGKHALADSWAATNRAPTIVDGVVPYHSGAVMPPTD
jgi:hypothetical protein